MDGELGRKDVKTTGGERVVMVAPMFLASLREHIGEPDAYIFATASGKPIALTYVRKHWLKKLAEAAALPSLTPYQLRHSSATECMRKCVPMTTAAAMLGHSTTKMLRDVYANTTSDMQKDATNRIATMFD